MVTMRRMMTSTMAAFAMVSAVPAAAEPVWPSQSAQVFLRITDRDFFRRNDRVTVRFESAWDGYVTVFRIDTDGRIRVLSPRDPWDDNRVVAGREYRVPNIYRQRGSHTFVVDDYPGVGYVFAVVSAEPFEYQPYVRNDHWEYTAVANRGRVTGDPYVAFVEVVERMLPGGEVPWSFDVVPYFVEQRYEYPRFLCYDCHAYVTYPRWDPYRDWCGTFRIVIYDDIHRYPRLYPATRVVYPTILAQPRYVIKTRTESEPFVTRAGRPGQHPTQQRVEPDRGVRGRDMGGVGNVPAPTRRVTRREESKGGIGGFIRRMLGGESDRDGARQPAVRQPDREQQRPTLERRTPTRRAEPSSTRGPAPTTRAQPTGRTVKKPQARPTERRPTSNPQPRRPSSPSRRIP
jgi:hypothetical protein